MQKKRTKKNNSVIVFMNNVFFFNFWGVFLTIKKKKNKNSENVELKFGPDLS